MYIFNNYFLICFLIIIFYICFYKNIDYFIFFIVLKTLYIYITINLLHEVIIYNSSGILVALIYILCVSILKSTLSILLLIINQNKNNTLFK